MTNVVPSTTTAEAFEASENFKDFKLYKYEKDFPLTCEAPDKKGRYIETRVFAGEKVLFAVKKVLEAEGKNNLQAWKFVWRLRNFCSQVEQISHPSSIYRGLAFAVFSTSNGRYTVTGLRVNGEKVSASAGELAEYLWSFIEDGINDFVYDNASNFEGKDTLVKIPTLYVKGTTAKEARPLTPEEAKAEAASKKSRVLTGIKLLETVVDGGTTKYPLIKLPLKMVGISTPTKLVAFPLEDICLYVDAAGLHTDRKVSGKVIHVMENTAENFEFFCESYCGNTKN